VATTSSNQLSRVTIVAPKTRIDLAVPSDIPLADMLPTLLRHAGEGLADDPAAREGWTLSRLGGLNLDTSRSPGQLDVRDGEMLYLRPRGTQAPELAFDDVVDAVATATRERAGRWQSSTTRQFGLTLAVVALIGGAAAILFAGPPRVLAGVVGLGGAIALLLTATVLSRAFGQSTIAAVFALVALVYAAVGGVLIGADDVTPLSQLGAPHLLLATAALLIGTAIATVAVASVGPLFLGTAVCVGALMLATAVCFVTGAPAETGAAAAAAIAFAWLPGLPMIAYRLARLPVPSVPAGPEDLKTDTESVDGQRVLDQSERADAFLAALLGAIAVIGAGASLVLAGSNLAGLVLASVLGLLMLARARWFLSRRQRLPLLGAGSVALGAAIVASYVAGGQLPRLIAVPALLVLIAGMAASIALAAGDRRRSPLPGRILDIFEMLLITAVIPLAVWASGLYSWIRSLNG
jgi:type VII secretion integral membrane protein EccD